MNQNTYPKVFTHRNDSKSQVVIANAEQEAELPPEYLPPVVIVTGQTISGADHAANVMLSPEYDVLLAEREKLEADRLAVAEERAALEKHRADLTAGYKESVAQLDADRAALVESQRQFDEEKAGAQPETAPAEDASGDAGAPASTEAPAAPARRVRTAKAD